MNVRETVGASLSLLNQRDRRILTLATLAQMSTAFLDLIGVLLLGVVTALSVSIASGGALPETAETVLGYFGFSGVEPASLAIALAMCAGFVLIGKSAVNMILTRRILRFLARRQAQVSGRLTAELLSRPLVQIQQRSSQNTAYALTDGVSVATIMVLGQSVVAASEITLLTVLALGLLVISPVVTVFTVAFFAIIAVVLQKILSGWAGRLGLRAANVSVASYSAIQEALRTYREVVVTHRRSLYVQRIQELRWQSALNQSEMQFMALVPKYVFEVALVVGAGVLAASQLLTKEVTAAVAVIAVFLAAGSRVVPSMLRLQTAAIVIRGAAGQASPTFELARELEATGSPLADSVPEGPSDPIQIRELLSRGFPDFVPEIVVSDVSVTYPGAAGMALEGVSLRVPAGASLALVGPTGAGKSTLADVILGVILPDSGTVELGGMTSMEAVSTWPGAIAYVPQEVAMVDGSVRDNVALGLPSAAVDDLWVWDALERAHLSEFLRAHRDGLDTVIGEHGVKLSGGQRQRLGVARALYTRPRILVLDEATSALDAETERAIASTLRALEGDVTTITVAHRLATIRHCDEVVYLDSGRVTARGTFDEVRSLSPHFDEQARLLGM